MSDSSPEQKSPFVHPYAPPKPGPDPLAEHVGAYPAPLSEADTERLRVMEFFQRLLALTPKAWATRVLMVAIIAWYVFMAVAGVDVLNPDSLDLIKYGANYGPDTLAGQWWRLASCMFVHVGLLHLAVNLWALYAIGPLVERMLGHVGYLLLYFLSGTLASFASVWFGPLLVSAGASGALFGLVGGLLGFLVRSRHSVPASAFRGLRNQLVMLIALNIALGFSMTGIDNAAHLGGLASGFVLGLILGQPIDEHTRVRRHWRNLTALLAGGGTLAGLLLFAAPPAPPDILGTLTEFERHERGYLRQVHELQQNISSGHITEAQFAQSLEQDVIGPYRVLHEALTGAKPYLNSLPKEQREAYDHILRYADMRLQAWHALLDWSQTQGLDQIEKLLKYRNLMEEGNRIATESTSPEEADQ